MKSSKIVLPKGDALPIANGLRQYAMTNLKSWRPIAFSLNREITYLEAQGDILTMPIRFQMDLSECIFEPICDLSGRDIVVDTITFTKDLYPSGLCTSNFKVHGREDKPLLSSIDGTVELKIIYRNGTSLYKREQNHMFLEEAGIDLKTYMVSASRHTNVKAFTFDIKESSESEDILTLSLESDIGNENQVLLDAASFFKDLVVKAHADLVKSLASN